METEVGRSALERLADAVGIVPTYLDQTGTEWRETTAESRVALLAAMGIDASSEVAAEFVVAVVIKVPVKSEAVEASKSKPGVYPGLVQVT